jgi:hypothetical protein
MFVGRLNEEKATGKEPCHAGGAEVDSCHFSVDCDCMAKGAAAAGQQRAPACCV